MLPEAKHGDLALSRGLTATQQEKSYGRGKQQRPPESGIGASPRRGIGARVCSPRGFTWGRAVQEFPRSWLLDCGRVAHMRSEGIRWRWARPAEASPPSRPPGLEHGPVATPGGVAPALYPPAPAPDALSPRLNATRRGFSSRPDPCAVSGLDTPGSTVLQPPPTPFARLPASAIRLACGWTELRPALRMAVTCRKCASALAGVVPAHLPPTLARLFLEHCLPRALEAVTADRLPLPLSAFWSDLRDSASRAAAHSAGRAALATAIAARATTRSLSRPRPLQLWAVAHHVAWVLDLRRLRFRNLKSLGRWLVRAGLLTVSRRRRRGAPHDHHARGDGEWSVVTVHRAHPLARLP